MEDGFFVSLRLLREKDGFCEVRHHEGSHEGLCGRREDGFEEVSLAQMEMKVVGFSQGDVQDDVQDDVIAWRILGHP